MRIAIVGAGMAGLACGEALRDAGHEVVLFDKGRGPGGRMSTRRLAAGATMLRFDHGAQYFTARDAGFAARVAEWAAAGQAARWLAAGADAWVGVPGMNAPVRAMAAGLDVRWATRIDALAFADGWRLTGEGVDAAGFDAVVVAVPAEQAAPLIAAHAPGIAAQAAAVRSAPCWTAMAAFAAPVASADDCFRDAGIVGWAARDSAKPGRSGPESWVIQATPEWSQRHLEAAAGTVERALLAALAERIGAPLPPAIATAAHRWRYARSGALGEGVQWDGRCGLGACGDWLIGPRVEAAWLSGRRLAAAMLADQGRSGQNSPISGTPSSTTMIDSGSPSRQ